jgi:hypothetical protein
MEAGAGARRRAAGAGAAAVVTIGNKTVNAFKFAANATAYIWFNSDGTTDTQQNTSSPVQYNASTDWIIPNEDGGSPYRTKYSSMTGDTGDYVGSISTVYSSLATNKYFAERRTTAGQSSVTFTAHIDDGTTEQDTATFTLTADREDF